MAKNFDTTRLMTTSAAIGAAVKSWAVSYRRAHEIVHPIFVSAVLMAAKDGNPVHLNHMYKTMTTNDQTAMKLYIRRIQTVLGGWDAETVKTTEEMTGFHDLGKFLSFKDGEFIVLKNDTSPNVKRAKTKMGILAKTIFKPDGKKWKPLGQANNLSEVKTFGDDEFKKGLAQLVKKANGETKNYNSTVDRKLVAQVAALSKKIGDGSSDTVTAH